MGDPRIDLFLVAGACSCAAALTACADGVAPCLGAILVVAASAAVVGGGVFCLVVGIFGAYSVRRFRPPFPWGRQARVTGGAAAAITAAWAAAGLPLVTLPPILLAASFAIFVWIEHSVIREAEAARKAAAAAAAAAKAEAAAAPAHSWSRLRALRTYARRLRA